MSENESSAMPPHSTRLAEEIDAGGRAVARVADPRVFPGAMAIIMLVIVIVLVLLQRQDMREEREGFLAALHENTTAVHDLSTSIANHFEQEALARAAQGGRR